MNVHIQPFCEEQNCNERAEVVVIHEGNAFRLCPACTRRVVPDRSKVAVLPRNVMFMATINTEEKA